jgi:hypothetical protein
VIDFCCPFVKVTRESAAKQRCTFNTLSKQNKDQSIYKHVRSRPRRGQFVLFLSGQQFIAKFLTSLKAALPI